MSGNSSRVTARRRPREDGVQTRWLVTYADMVTLLLTFFVLLFAFSELDAQRFETFLVALQGAFGVLDGGPRVLQDDSVFEDLNELRLEDIIRPELLAQLQGVYAGIGAFVAERGLGDSLQVDYSERGVVVRFADRVLFDLGRADLKPEAVAILDQLAEFLRTIPNHVRVEGHTDDLPINNERFPSNWELSTARATNVVRYFIEKHGLDPTKFSAAGYGEYRPLVPNDSMENRALNRRVDIVLLRLDLGE